MKPFAALSLAALFCSAPALAASDAMTGAAQLRARDLAATCAGCHGTDGRSVGDIAALAGLPRDELLARLLAFRRGERPSTVMRELALGYSEDELALIAAYLSQRPAAAPGR